MVVAVLSLALLAVVDTGFGYFAETLILWLVVSGVASLFALLGVWLSRYSRYLIFTVLCIPATSFALYEAYRVFGIDPDGISGFARAVLETYLYLFIVPSVVALWVLSFLEFRRIKRT
jgi:hypothetical protein